jgi:hypothetical protein
VESGHGEGKDNQGREVEEGVRGEICTEGEMCTRKKRLAVETRVI